MAVVHNSHPLHSPGPPLSVLISEAASAPISQAIMSASISMVFADGALLAYSVTLPLVSQLYLTFHNVLPTLSPDVHGKVANPIPLLFFHSYEPRLVHKHGVLDLLRDLRHQ